MKHEDRDKLGLTEDEAKKLEANVHDAFKTVVKNMQEKAIGDFSELEIIIYTLTKNDILKDKKNISLSIIEHETTDLEHDIEDSKISLYKAYKDYKEMKKKYHAMAHSDDKADAIEAHEKIGEALHRMLGYIEDTFRDIWSCSECEEERKELIKAVKTIAEEYKIA